jgi:hypothetical protein
LRLEARDAGPYYHPDYDADDNPFLWYIEANDSAPVMTHPNERGT